VVIDNLVAHFAFKNATGSFKQFQRAVDSGLIDTGHLSARLPDDFLGSDMAIGFMDDIRNQYSLRSEFQPFFL